MEGNLLEAVKGKVLNADKKQLFLLVVLFLMAFGIRAHLAKYDLMFGFDSYYHARINAEVIQYGVAPAIDTMSWYSSQGGGAPLPGVSDFFWQVNAFVYNVFTLGSGYDKQAWINVVKILPALYGALICVAMFFLGKEIYGKKAGYVAGCTMAFFAAVVPAFVYRTMGGFLEEDALGFLWMVVGLVFLAKALREPELTRRKLGYAALSGVFFGLMALTWQLFLLIPLVLVSYLIFAAMNIYSEKGFGALKPFAAILAVSMGTLTAITWLFVPGGLNWISRSFSYLKDSIPPSMSLLVFGGGAVLLALVAYLMFLGSKSKQPEQTNKTIKLIAMLLLFGTLLLLATIIVSSPNLWEAAGVLGKSVGEESPGRNYFGEKYNALIILPALALILIPWRVYRKRNDHLSIMLFFWIFATFFMAWYKLKFTYAFGLPVAAAAGIVAIEIFDFLKTRTAFEKQAVLAALGLMFLVGAAAGMLFVEDKVPNIEQPVPDWKGALKWLSEETPEDAKMFNWWDYGHWISFVGERAVLSDNRNLYLEPLQDIAKFIITPDLNESLRIIESYDSDYVIVSFDHFQKQVSYAMYAYNTLNQEDHRIIPYRSGPAVSFVCNPSIQGSEQMLVCGPNSLSMPQAETLKKDWTNQPNQLIDNRIPVFIYVDKDGYAMYGINPAVNDSTLAKLWFHNTEAMEFFEEVYGAKGIKIFRVKKDAIANAV